MSDNRIHDPANRHALRALGNLLHSKGGLFSDPADLMETLEKVATEELNNPEYTNILRGAVVALECGANPVAIGAYFLRLGNYE